MVTTLISLSNLASEANAWIECAKIADDRARDARLAAGKALARAKERVRAGEPGHRNWAKWVRENITHSYRYTNKCVALAKSPNPRAALSAEREHARRSMAISRAKVGPTLDPPVPSAQAVGQVLVDPDAAQVAVAAINVALPHRGQIGGIVKEATPCPAEGQAS